jgi:hypothetical protein
MIFSIIIFVTAFLMEGIGSYISVVGLASVSSDLVILFLAIILDFAKIVSVSLLYKFWDRINALTKTYLIPAVLVTMIITSAGAYGYLRETFQRAILPNQESAVQIDSLTQKRSLIVDRIAVVDARKSQIDDQISRIPDTSVKAKRQLLSTYAPEKNQLNSERTTLSNELTDIDKKIPELKNAAAKSDNHVGGPVVAVAETFNISKDSAIKIVAAVIISIFDPLAIVLILCGNIVWSIYVDDKRKEPITKLQRELEEAKWLHEAEKLKLVYQNELGMLANTSIEQVEPQIEVQTEEIEPIETLAEEIVKPQAAIEEDAPRRVKKQKSDLNEPRPSVSTESSLASVVDVISKSLEIADVKPLTEDSQITRDESATDVIIESINDAVVTTAGFSDKVTAPHPHISEFYKSSVIPS